MLINKPRRALSASGLLLSRPFASAGYFSTGCRALRRQSPGESRNEMAEREWGCGNWGRGIHLLQPDSRGPAENPRLITRRLKYPPQTAAPSAVNQSGQGAGLQRLHHENMPVMHKCCRIIVFSWFDHKRSYIAVLWQKLPKNKSSSVWPAESIKEHLTSAETHSWQQNIHSRQRHFISTFLLAFSIKPDEEIHLWNVLSVLDWPIRSVDSVQ